MTGIFGKASLRADKTNGAPRTGDGNRPVETSGSLAMWQQSLLMASAYDSFSTANPFAVDYAAYGMDMGAAADFTSGFLASFSNAVSVLGDGISVGFSGGGGFSSGGGFSGGGGGGFSGGGGGGFSSTC